MARVLLFLKLRSETARSSAENTLPAVVEALEAAPDVYQYRVLKIDGFVFPESTDSEGIPYDYLIVADHTSTLDAHSAEGLFREYRSSLEGLDADLTLLAGTHLSDGAGKSTMDRRSHGRKT